MLRQGPRSSERCGHAPSRYDESDDEEYGVGGRVSLDGGSSSSAGAGVTALCCCAGVFSCSSATKASDHVGSSDDSSSLPGVFGGEGGGEPKGRGLGTPRTFGFATCERCEGTGGTTVSSLLWLSDEGCSGLALCALVEDDDAIELTTA